MHTFRYYVLVTNSRPCQELPGLLFPRRSSVFAAFKCLRAKFHYTLLQIAEGLTKGNWEQEEDEGNSQLGYLQGFAHVCRQLHHMIGNPAWDEKDPVYLAPHQLLDYCHAGQDPLTW